MFLSLMWLVVIIILWTCLSSVWRNIVGIIMRIRLLTYHPYESLFFTINYTHLPYIIINYDHYEYICLTSLTLICHISKKKWRIPRRNPGPSHSHSRRHQGAWPKMFSQRLSNGCQVAAASVKTSRWGHWTHKIWLELADFFVFIKYKCIYSCIYNRSMYITTGLLLMEVYEIKCVCVYIYIYI